MHDIRIKMERACSGQEPKVFVAWMKDNLDDFTMSKFLEWAKKNNGILGDSMLIAVYDFKKLV